jgi:hypothetical protein
MRANASRRFNILAKKVYAYSKKNNLEYKWQDAQKWTSKNLWSSYKKDTVKKISSKSIDDEIAKLFGQTASAAQVKKTQEVCYNPFYIPSSELEDFSYWMLADEISKFDANLNIAIELDGYINTGIVKKSTIGDLVPIREAIRKDYGSSASDAYQLLYRILVRPDKKDDGKPCSYYLLVTNGGSPQDNSSASGEVVKFVSEDSLPETVKKKREAEEQRKKQQKVKATKKAARDRPRPQQVEARSSGTNTIQLETDKYNALNRTLEILREDFKDGILTKKQYQDRQKEILKKFESGGNI